MPRLTTVALPSHFGARLTGCLDDDGARSAHYTVARRAQQAKRALEDAMGEHAAFVGQLRRNGQANLARELEQAFARELAAEPGV